MSCPNQMSEKYCVVNSEQTNKSNQTLPQGLSFFQRGWLSSNNVLLRDREQAILIDTGYWTHSAQTLDLVQRSLGKQALTRIINTHLHSDHCGGNAALQRAYPAVETLVPPGHANFVFDWDPAALTYTPTGQHCPKFSARGVIRSGDRFSVSNQEWLALAAPGHDPHAIILFCEETGVLISADALWENGFGVVFPEIEGIEAFEDVAKTLDLIASLQVTVVLPGHGEPFTNVKVALANARKRLASFHDVPEKHANYAAKVLLKFKLLELQTVEEADFEQWAMDCDYLKLLQQRYANHLTFGNWFRDLLLSLEKNGALICASGKLINR